MRMSPFDLSARATKAAIMAAAAIAALAIQSHVPATAQSVGVPQRAPSMLMVSAPPDTDDVGSFAFGYVEFDRNPANGVPGFSSWPPAYSKRP